MLKVAVIGMGNIGNTHAPVYQADNLAELVAVCDIIKERADRAAERYGVRAYYSVEEMLRHEELDVVSVCSAGVENGGDHFEPTMQCLEAGLHVLGEKPISNEIEKARQMVAKADQKGVYYGINLNHRFVPPAAKAKQWVEEGQPQRDVALVPHARPASAFARHHALLLWRRRARARLLQSGAGPRLLLQRAGQPAIRQRRRRPPHGQLRHEPAP